MYRVYFDLNGSNVFLDVVALNTADAQCQTLLRYPKGLLIRTIFMPIAAAPTVPNPEVPPIMEPGKTEEPPLTNLIKIDFQTKKRIS